MSRLDPFFNLHFRISSFLRKARFAVAHLSCKTTTTVTSSERFTTPSNTGLIQHAVPAAPVCAAGRILGRASGHCEIAGRRISYSLQVGFEAENSTGSRHAGVRGWALDLNNYQPGVTLYVTSQNGERLKFLPNEPRGDALAQAGVPKKARAQAIRCGFSGYIPNAGDNITLILEVDGQSYIVGTGYPDTPQILVGQNGWLFLAGDSNDSPGQFIGNHEPSTNWLRDWDAYFSDLLQLRESKIGGQLCFLIAPSKESLFPDYYPLARGSTTPLDSLIKRFGSVPELLYPVDVLSRLRELSYDKAETHWTHFGARIVCHEILLRFGISNPPLPLHFELPLQSGDLGGKAVPPVRTHRANANWPNPSKVIFDNFVLHHGRIRVTSNPQARKQQTCVLFGGSSGEHMERYLTAIFARVVYVYSAGAWDPEILKYERPAFTILQSSERFLIRAPSSVIDSSAIVSAKISAGHVIKKESRKTVLAEWTDPSVVLYSKMG